MFTTEKRMNLKEKNAMLSKKTMFSLTKIVFRFCQAHIFCGRQQ